MLLPWQFGLLGWICGLFARDFPLPALLVCGVAGLAPARRRDLALMAACFVAGALACSPPARPEVSTGSASVRVRGVIEEVRTSPGKKIVIVASNMTDASGGRILAGRLLWTWTDPPDLPRPGQSFEAVLRIRELRGRANFGLGSGEEYWRRRDVRYRAYAQGRIQAFFGHDTPDLRRRLQRRVESLVPEGVGGAAVLALVFGDRFRLDPAFMERVRRAGLAHSLALSGLHLSLAAALGLGAGWLAGRLRPGLLLRRPRRELGMLLAVPMVLAYLWLGGFTPSLLRASLMLAAAGASMCAGTRSHPQDCLCAAVAVLTAADPLAVRELGLQLSVLAVAGIVLFMPLWPERRDAPHRNGPGWRCCRAIAQIGAVTVCANLFSLPVQILYFSEISAHLWLNLLWLPVLSFVVLPAALAGLAASLVWTPAAGALFALAGKAVETLDAALRAMERAGMLETSAVLRPHGVEVVGYWIVLVSGCVLLGGRGRRRFLALLGLGIVLMAAPTLSNGIWRPGVEMTVIDTGMSQAVYVRTPSGKTVLVDGGGGWGDDWDPGRAIVGPVLAWGRPPEVDAVLLSHVDADHVRGLLYILRSFSVGWFGWSGLSDSTSDSRRLAEALDQGGMPVRVLRAGARVQVENDLWLEVLHPAAEERGPSSNETSLVLRLVWKGRGLALLPGDAQRHALDAVLRGGGVLAAEVLVLPHHGSKSSLHPGLYARVGARWAVAACGPGNRFGFPHAAVTDACRLAGSEVLTTAERGAVRFTWREGERAAVTFARAAP